MNINFLSQIIFADNVGYTIAEAHGEDGRVAIVLDSTLF